MSDFEAAIAERTRNDRGRFLSDNQTDGYEMIAHKRLSSKTVTVAVATDEAFDCTLLGDLGAQVL